MTGSRGVFTLVAVLVAALALVGGLQARPDAGPYAAAGVVRVGEEPTARTLFRFERTALSRMLDKALAVPHVRRASTGALAIDVRTGTVLYALHPDRALVPASNEKLPTTYAALKQLGPSYRFRTQVLGTGEQDGAVWNGNLFLRGGGDPTLHVLQLQRLAAQLREAGIRRVTGRVLADESFFDAKRVGPGWKPSFYMDESPPLSALVVDRAMVDGRMSEDPAGTAAARFTNLLEARGIEVVGRSGWGTAPEDAFALAQVESQPLADILRFMDRQSDNFIAEQVLKTLGAEVRGKGTTGAGAAVVVDTLKEAGVPLANVRIADGSGLSRLDRLTPRAIASILLAAWGDDELRPIVWDAMPVSGRIGTLKRRLDSRPALGAVHAKTGTTALSSALSGFVRRRYVFVVVQNGHPISSYWARAAQDRFAAALAAR